MKKIDQQILDINQSICENIDAFDIEKRWLLSQNILDKLRNFIEHISLKIYADPDDIENIYENIQDSISYIKPRGKLKFLSKFHKLLQTSTSHYTPNKENSERLMLKYYWYLIQIKSYLKNKYDFDVLENIDEFPICFDPDLKEYYEKVVEKINKPKSTRTKVSYNDRYYIRKVKPFFINNEAYYEITFTVATDNTSKFDRIIAFTKLNILPNYAVKFSLNNDYIEILDKKMPIQIIDEWEVSIRPCEINYFADIFGEHTKISAWINEYYDLMSILTKTNLNLVDIVEFSDEYYQRFTDAVLKRSKTRHIIDVLYKVRELIKEKKQWENIVRYLLYKINNKILKPQLNSEPCSRLSNLYLNRWCIPFDDMPFNSSPMRHNPKISDLFDCIDNNDREHELFARSIKSNTEENGNLYTSCTDLVHFDDINALIDTYNWNLYVKHREERSLAKFKWHVYIKNYESDTLNIIEKLRDLSLLGVRGYTSSIDTWLQSPDHGVDCIEKKQILRQVFERSHIAMIYGSAGTGKTTLINHISNFHKDQSKLYLANTNPAVNNLKRRVSVANSDFKTIARFLSDYNDDTNYDLLIIDECSTVSNWDMCKILEKSSFKLLILVGDIYQIESILFGNWFWILKSFVPETSVFELTKPYRSSNDKLITLWDKVRKIDEKILEHITKNDYSSNLDESIFAHSENDEIILCLNYDGLYGINNINRFLQSSNSNDPVEWGVHTYKINDPILFNDSNRFSPLIYNNLKGRIIDIELFEDKILFDIEINESINELHTYRYDDLDLLWESEDWKSIIRFFVNKLKNTDEDDESSSAVVPFQIAYAVSVHKAQGLEYESVKVVITDEVEEMFTHNIFYTAITRAKEKLKIYWTPDTENKVLSNLQTKFNNKDIHLLKSKFSL